MQIHLLFTQVCPTCKKPIMLYCGKGTLCTCKSFIYILSQAVNHICRNLAILGGKNADNSTNMGRKEF